MGIELLKHDRDAIKNIGIECGIDLCRKLTEFGVNVLHFYTLNLEKVVVGITDALGITMGLTQKMIKTVKKLMVSIVSSWARVGDPVVTDYGKGVVSEIKSNGITVVELSKWILSREHKAVVYLG